MGLARQKRPFNVHQLQFGDINTSTAASTALQARGVVTMETTSTGAAVVYTLARVPEPGDFLVLHAGAVATSSAGAIHVNAGGTAAGEVAFGSSSQDMLTFGTTGQSAYLTALSSDLYATVTRGATLSTST